MRILQINVFSLIVVVYATTCLGQYGLYGSPDPIKVPQQETNTVSTGGYTAGSSGYTAPASYVTQPAVQTYPSTQTYPTTQPYPVQQAYPVQQVQQQPYTAQAVQPYAPQAASPYMTQSVQSYAGQGVQPARPAASYGTSMAQYRTPTYSRPAYYTAGAEQAMANPGATGQPALSAPSAMSAPQMAPGIQTGAMPEPVTTPAAQQNMGVTNQMLAEQGQSNSLTSSGWGTCAPNGGQCSAYGTAVNQPACGNYLEGYSSESSLWYASLTAFAMTRDRPNKVYITYETGNEIHNDYPVDEMSWRWGGEVRVGRRFCSGCNQGCNTGCNSGCGSQGFWALEASYWTLDSFQGFVSHTSPVSPTNPNGTVGTPLTVGYNEFLDVTHLPTPAYRNARDWFDGAGEHRLWRWDEIQSFELNLARGQWCYGPDSPWDLGFALGIRYFRFQESWKFGSRMDECSWDEQGGAYAAYLRDLITNNLIGPQLSFEVGYSMNQCLRFYMAPKVGIYNNNITNNFQAYLGNGQISRPVSPYQSIGSYPVDSSVNSISFLTQFDVGLDWRWAQRWSGRIGYRVVTVSGIGLADAQVPFYIVDVPAIAEIDRNGDLIMHGGFISLAYNF
jgi:hypothetical protein